MVYPLKVSFMEYTLKRIQNFGEQDLPTELLKLISLYYYDNFSLSRSKLMLISYFISTNQVTNKMISEKLKLLIQLP